MLVVHTREGHRPDLSDCPPAKLAGAARPTIGTEGPNGPHPRPRRGRARHRRRARAARPGEVVLDKPGKGSFYATDLELMLRNHGITSLIVTGVTTEVCVHTTVREANDRGFECLVLSDCVGSYFPRVPRGGAQDDRRPGRHLRLGAPSAALLAALTTAAILTRRADRDEPMTTAVPAPRLPLWTRGDLNASFGLGINMLVNVLVLAGLSVGVVGLSGDDVYETILPALGIQLLVGNIFYFCLAPAPGRARKAAPT